MDIHSAFTEVHEQKRWKAFLQRISLVCSNILRSEARTNLQNLSHTQTASFQPLMVGQWICELQSMGSSAAGTGA